MPYLKHDGPDNPVFELFLGTEGVELDEFNPENRMNPDWIKEVNTHLETVEKAAAEGPAALVITATGKFFTNGLDVGYVMSNIDKFGAYIDLIHALYARILTLPCPTIAAINGHAFGGGAMLAKCADFSFMRIDRGFWSLPEVTLNMPFPRGMASLLTTRLPNQVAVEAMTTGHRYSATEAEAASIVDRAVPLNSLVAAAADHVRPMAGYAGPNFAGIKASLYRVLLQDLAEPVENLSLGG